VADALFVSGEKWAQPWSPSNSSQGSAVSNPTEKNEIIELALQESVGGGIDHINLCEVSCHILSYNICHIMICRIDL
jgi:hypothetical protein